MATISERLAYVLTFDTTSGVKSIEKFGQTADKELSKADKKLDKLGANMVKFGAGAIAFAGVAGAGLVKMASGAADAQANMSALEQVVGEVAASEIGKWAEDSARGVGMASKEAVAASTQFAGLGKIIGLAGKPLAEFAQGHVELAADMAAFKNVSPEVAVQDLSAAYAGSTEVLRKYNIFLDERTLKEAYARETGEKVSGTLSTQQKIIAINSELYRQGADMLGQWGRESGELTGQQAILRAELTNLSDNIGAGVLPMLTQVMSVATSVTGALASLSPEATATAGRFVALGVAGIGLVGTLSMVAGQVIKMRDRFTDATGTINTFGRIARGAGIAMGVAGAAMAVYSVHAAIAAQESQNAAEAIEDLTRASDDEMVINFAEAMVKGALAGDGFEDALQDIARATPGTLQRMLDMEDASGGLTAQFVAQGLSTEEAAEWVAKIGDALAAEKVALDNAEASAAALNSTTDESTTAAEEAAVAVRDAAEAEKARTEAVNEATEALHGQQKAIEAVRDATMEGRDSSLAYRNQVARTTEAIREGTLVQLDSARTDEEKAQAARDVEAAVYDQADAARTLAIDMNEAAGKTLSAEAADKVYRDELQRLADTLNGPARAAIDAHIAALGRIPRSIYTNVGISSKPGREGDFERFQTGVGATGGIVTQPTMSLIGEAGPEAVIPLNKMPGASPLPSNIGGNAGGGNTYVTVNAYGADPQQVVEAIKKYARRNGPGSVPL